MVATLALNDEHLERYRRIAMAFIDQHQAEVEVLQVDNDNYCINFKQADGKTQLFSDNAGNLVCSSLEEIRQLLDESYLPSLGLFLELENVKRFQLMLANV